VSVCLSVCEHICGISRSPNFYACYLWPWLVRCFGDFAICYVLPVLRRKSCLYAMARNRRIIKMTHQGAARIRIVDRAANTETEPAGGSTGSGAETNIYISDCLVSRSERIIPGVIYSSD